MLNPASRKQIQDALRNMQQPVEFRLALDASAPAQELEDFATDFCRLSEKLSISPSVLDARKPSLSIGLQGEEPRVQFAGLPRGHELSSFVLAVLHVSGHAPKFSAADLQRLDALEGVFQLETFYSASCQNCPEVIQALDAIAARNPSVTHVAIDGAVFQSEVAERNILAVPAVYLNGKPFLQGRASISEIVEKLAPADPASELQRWNQKETYDVLVIGGGPAGASAAVYAARKGIRVGLLAERFGGQVLDTQSIQNYLSVPETDGPRFAAALEEHVNHYDVEMLLGQRVKRLAPGQPHQIHLENNAVLKAKTVVIATGARWRNLGVPGEKQYQGPGVTYCPHCDGPLFRDQSVAVVGGGNSGVEAAIDLAGIAQKVALFEIGDELRADAVLKEKLSSLSNVDVHCGAALTKISGNGQKVNSLEFESKATGALAQLDIDGVFVQAGLVPNSQFLEGVVDLTAQGEVLVNERGATNISGVFAAGDVTTVPYKQIIIATGEGAKASLGAFDHLMRA
ncbi:MAG: alkyl hydroperoxide reductase subunit F [Polyangiaceae bacterium]|nr:alkyl hydroperoxide reductase subunit F [Polyangiaceae bacterium]